MTVDDALSALTPDQRAALELLLRRERAAAAPRAATLQLTPIPRRAGRATFPLSFAQQRLWFLDQLFPGDPAYNIHGALCLRGALDVAALAAGLRAITARHEVLRSRFQGVEGRPVQSIAPPGDPALPVVDLGSLAAGRRAAEVVRLAVAEARRPFDLARGPLLRATLLRAGAAESVLLVTMHHIVSDGWSIGVLQRDLAAFYTGRPSPLPPLPLQYADFAACQQQQLAGDRLAGEVAHWRSRLAGVPELRLPEEPRAGSVSSVPLAVPEHLAGRLKELGRGAGASLFMTLLAVFELLLLRWSGQPDFAVGTPIANRNRLEIEGLIGFFVNTLVLRADLAGDPPFLGLLERVRQTALDAFTHEELPFEKLVEELQPERRIGRNPLFSTLFTLQPPGAADPVSLPGLEVTSLPVRNGTARFDLVLELAEGKAGLNGFLEHGPATLSPVAAQRMAGHFLALLEAVVADPVRPLSELPFLTAAERHQILVEWAGPERPVPAAGFGELFAEQAARSPDTVAVVCEAESLSHGELDAWSSRLARYLRRLGAGPEVAVAISLERSLEMVVGLLAILKAGAAYLPIDPRNPGERRSFMLEDCGAAVLLTQQRWAASFRRPGLRVLCLDSGREAFAGEPATAPPRLGRPGLPGLSGLSGNALALLYTSGSTGRPKATVIEEHGFLNLCAWFREVCAMTSSTRALLGFAFSFDAAFKNIVVPLLAGGRLVLANPGPFDAVEMWAALRDEGVTFLNTTPSQIEPILRLAAADGYASLASLEGLILGGEAAAWSELRPWLESGRCRSTLTNMYGPSECSDTVTSHRVAPGELGGGRLPVGRAGFNMNLVVMDADFLPLPVGVPGELCASGICLSRGYFGRPELTAERFVPAPLLYGERMYRTGDLARRLPDGNLEILGRLDHQIKIRGVRVEPAEVEAALTLHPAVRSAVVLARPGRRASDVVGVNVRLVAWIVPAAGTAGPAEVELRRFLRSRLPEVMIPSEIVTLAALPLSPRGKLDRSALPEPAADRAAAEAVSPLTGPDEELMATLFAELLGRERVGIRESFFEIGGHSLLATRLISRVRTVFGVELPVRRLFESPTPAELAAAVRGLGGTLPAAPPLRRREGGGPAPLSPAQQRLWVLHQLSPGLTAYHIPAALRLRGRLDKPALARALTAVAARHAALRTHFPMAGAISEEGPVQAVEPPAPVPLPEIDLAALPEAAREAAALRLAGEEARRPFDLERGPLLRLRLLRLGPGEHALLLTVQHLVSDGWSAAIFLRELSALYAAGAAGTPVTLPELPVQYTDYAVWQRGWLRGEVLEAQLGFWKARLAGAPRFLDLPTDRPRPPVESHAGAALPLRLAAPLVERLRHLGREAGATLYMTLLAGFQALLARAAGEEAVSVGTHVAGRNRTELEGLIGFFVNTLVIHTRNEGAPPVRGLIGRVREAVLGAFSHQDLPFEKLVEALNPERDPRWSPLFQVVFSLQNLPQEELRLPGIAASRLEVETHAVQFDLIASLAEAPDGEALGSLRYRTALFDATTVRRLAGSFEILLAGMADDPERRAAELPLLSAAARWHVLAEWGGAGGVEEIAGATLPALFAAQAARAPGAPAVVLDGETLSYGELLQRADRVAGALRRRGVGTESRVAIHLGRSPDLLAAILGVLRAGGAYVPLDPASPRERLAFLLEDAAPAVVLTARDLLATLPSAAAPVVLLEEAIREEALPTLPAPAPDDLAYMIYTSGSTGRPKGTLVRHGALTAFFHGLREAVAELRGGPLRFSLNASFAFDASLQQIVQLAAGHALWIVPEEARRDGERMAAFLRTAELDGFDCTPSQLDLLLAAMEASGRPPRFVLVGGEAIAPALWARLAAHPRTRFYNVYGPTECTIDTTARRIESMAGGPDLGRPLAGYRVHLLDAGGLPLPAGFRGEISIGGPVLARGYWRRPGLTADRFRPDPFGAEPGARLYRTGDLGCWLADGRIASFGRADQQIKLRGFRIEPGEIEAGLASHPAVAEAAVALRGDAAGAGEDRRLVAWVTAADPLAPPEPRELRRWLAQRLPEAMIPAVVTVLDALPRTASGKLDRRALPEPPRESGAARVAQAAAPLARLLALFREVLGVPEVLPEDSFFALGGHSLSALRLAARIRETFGARIPVRRLFIAPTPAALAGLLQEAAAGEASALPLQAPPPIRRVPRDGAPFPLSFAQQRLWVLHQLTPGLTAYHLPAGFRLRGRLDTAALERALTEIVRRHESLRTRFPVRGGEPVQEIDPPAPVPLPEIDLAALPPAAGEEEARRLAAAEARRLFDLAAGPLVRVRLLGLGTADHVLFLVVHHLVSDGWSTAVFLRELTALYTAFRHGEASPLPEPAIQYADYTVAQRAWEREALAAQLSYWTQRLAGSPWRLDLPTDRERPPIENDAGATLELHLPRELVDRLRRLGRSLEGGEATLFMILLAAFQALLSRASGQETVNVGTPVARRDRREIEPLIGFFVNTLVLRADIPEDLSWKALVAQVRDSALGAFAHQDLPFEKLVEAFRPDRDPRWSPLFQVTFTLFNVPREELRLPGLEISRLAGGETGTVQFDLAAALVETADGVAGSLSYRTALFEESTIRRLADRYVHLLAALAADPDAPVALVVDMPPGALLTRRPDGRRLVLPPAPSALPARPHSEPRNAREQELLDLFREVLGVADATVHDSFFDLGGHSLAAYRLATRIHEVLGAQLPVREIFAASTVAELALRLDVQDGESDPRGLIIALQPRGVRPPFFCIHPGGGGVTVYRALALALDSDRSDRSERPFLALRAPGLEAGEEPSRDICALAELYSQELRRAQPEGPWHLGGWSSGAVIAFETARRLRAAGGEVAALVLLDPPDLPIVGPDPDDVEILAAFARDLGLSPDAFELRAAEARALSPDERLTALLEAVQAAGLPRIDRAGLERRLRVFQAIAEAVRAYEPGCWEGPLTLLEAAARPAPAAFWRTLAITVATVPGDHTTILQPPQVEELARRVREALG